MGTNPTRRFCARQSPQLAHQGLIPRLIPIGVVVSAGSPPQSGEAYDLYLRTLAVSHDARANEQAITMLQRAVALDPHYAPAWQELGQRYYFKRRSGDDPSRHKTRNREHVVWLDRGACKSKHSALRCLLN